jgi:hypothetical protein
MERPYQGRAIIEDNLTDLQIIIPVKRNWFVILFLGAWLCGWFLGEIAAIAGLTGLLGGNFGGFFILFWLIAWTVGGILALKTFIWNLKGKEIITIGQGSLTIDKKGSLLFKSKTYDLNEVKNLRVQDDHPGSSGLFGRSRNDLSTMNSSGTIRFDYGLKTIKFAEGIDEAEANFIVQKLKGWHLIREKNFSVFS